MIVEGRSSGRQARGVGKQVIGIDLYKKAGPEAEALLITKKEQDGDYYMLSDSGQNSPAWFISHTSMLNGIIPGSKITWQPEAFLSFVSSLAPVPEARLADRAFEMILWGIAESGLSLLDEDIVESVLGGVIEQATLDIVEQVQVYDDCLADKYGQSVESVMEQVRPASRPLAAIQLANERAQSEERQRKLAQAEAAEAAERAGLAEKEVRKLSHVREKMEERKRRGKKRRRSSKKKKGRKQRKSRKR